MGPLRKLLRQLVYQYPSLELLERHAEKVCETVEALAQLLEDYLEGRDVRGREARISELEHEADLLKAQVRSALPRSDSFLPVARSDLLEFVWHQDKIADKAQDAAGLVPLLRVDLPPEMATRWRAFVELLREGTSMYRQMAHGLRELLEQGFQPERVERVLKWLQEVNVLEHRADVLEHELIRLIYDRRDLDGFAKYHLIQVLTTLGSILDHMENAGGRIRLMVAR